MQIRGVWRERGQLWTIVDATMTGDRRSPEGRLAAAPTLRDRRM